MAFRHIGDVLSQAIPKTLTEACFLVGVVPKQVPFDGKPHSAHLINDRSDIDNGQIKIQPGGLCGCVINTKTNKSIGFVVRATVTSKQSQPDFKAMKACLGYGG